MKTGSHNLSIQNIFNLESKENKENEMLPEAKSLIGGLPTFGSLIYNPGIQEIVKSTGSLISGIIHTSLTSEP